MSQNMRRLFLVVLFGFGLIVSLVSAEAPKAVDGLLASVAREVRKNDAWVESVMQADYTTGASIKSVQLQFVSKKEDDGQREMGICANNAAYSPISHALLLPLSQPVVDVVDAIDHELFHVLYSEGNYVGLIHQKGFYGPTDGQIADFAKKKVSSPAFAELHKRIQQAQEEQQLVQRFKIAMVQNDTRLSLLRTSLQDTVAAIGPRSKMREVFPFVPAGTLEQQRKQLTTLCASMMPMAIGMKKFGEELEKSHSSGKVTSDVVRQWSDQFEHWAKLLGPLSKKAQQLNAVAQKTMELAEEKSVQAIIDGFNKKIALERDPAAKQELIRQKQIGLDYQESQKRMKALLGGFDVNKTNAFSAMIQESMVVLSVGANQEKIKEVIDSPNEVMARVVDSAYSLYYGPVSQNQYPLDENDLKFLESFTFEGRPLFRKGVEKYRLGLAMVADGIKAEEVKAKLEYASAFAYKGKVYSWPESKFEIRGTPPYREIPELPKEGGNKGK